MPLVRRFPQRRHLQALQVHRLVSLGIGGLASSAGLRKIGLWRRAPEKTPSHSAADLNDYFLFQVRISLNDRMFLEEKENSGNKHWYGVKDYKAGTTDKDILVAFFKIQPKIDS